MYFKDQDNSKTLVAYPPHDFSHTSNFLGIKSLTDRRYISSCRFINGLIYIEGNIDVLGLL